MSSLKNNKNPKHSKQKSVKFLLAPRSQKDPLAADYEAPQHVLIPKDGSDIEVIKEKLPDFDPEVFPSKEVTRTGMLERAHNADGVTFDPDLLNAMSKDFDYEDPNNILDDDFMGQAGGLIEDEGELLDGEMTDLTADLFEDDPEVIVFNKQDGDHEQDDGSQSCDSDDFNIDNLESTNEDGEPFNYGKKLILFKKKVERQPKFPFRRAAETHTDSDEADDYGNDDEDETKTVFTNYSMTSSVMRRNQGLQQIDEHFERLYEREYANDTEIGALDLNEVKGEELLTNINQIRQMKEEVRIVRQRNHGDDYEPEIVSEHHKDAIIGDDPLEESKSSDDEYQRKESRLDCESILSHNSTLYNHPKLIREPKKRTNSQATSDLMDVDDLEVRSRSGHESIASSRATVLSKLSIRPSNETPEERKIRKKALKEYRHLRRQERKQNQSIFKKEQESLNKQQRTNITALKLA